MAQVGRCHPEASAWRTEGSLRKGWQDAEGFFAALRMTPCGAPFTTSSEQARMTARNEAVPAGGRRYEMQDRFLKSN